MTEEMHALLARLNLQLGQLHRTVQDLTRHCEPSGASEKDDGMDIDFVAKAQYLALEAAIRLQGAAARQQQSCSEQATAPDVTLGASSWRLARNGWRLVAYEHGTEIRLRPLERSLLLRLAHSPGQRLSPQELRGLDRDLAGTAGDGADGIDHAADNDTASDEADGSAVPLHAKVIARLRRRMRMRGHMLPVRMSPTAGVYVNDAVENAREGWGTPNRRPSFRHPRSADASAAAHPES